MHLLFSITTYPPSVGGAQIHLHSLGQQMIGWGHKVKVIGYWDCNRSDWLMGTTLAAKNQGKDYIIDGIPVHLMGFSLTDKLCMLPWIPLYYPLMPLAVSHLSRYVIPKLVALSQNVDVIHNVRIGREVLSYASLRLARQLGIPFVLTPVHHPRWSGWRYQVFDEIYRQADALIALTDSERQALQQKGVAPEKIHVTGTGPIVAAVADGMGFRQKHQIIGPMVLFLGQHYAYKGYQQVLQATSIVWQSLPETYFVFVGPQVKQSERVFAEFRDPRIVRLGSVSLQEKSDALAACDLLCVPSTQESFGGVYTEAWMYQKPVIGCPIPAVSEVITNGVDGILVKQDPQEIAQTILMVLKNPDVANNFGVAGQKKVREKYSWSQLAQKTLGIYQFVLRNG